MRPAAPQWRTIGGSLGILDSDLGIIQHKPALIQEGTTGYLREMLSQWLKWASPNHPSPTLEALVVALQNIGHESLAVNLKSMFLQRKGWFVCMLYSTVSNEALCEYYKKSCVHGPCGTAKHHVWYNVPRLQAQFYLYCLKSLWKVLQYMSTQKEFYTPTKQRQQQTNSQI